MKLSIIIPYYETYEMTKSLLISLSPQLSSEVEIILIDDGCNEKGLDEIINSEENLWRCCKLIHKKNGGVSKARNTGIEKACGKYVAFIDSDDMITTDYVDRLLELINTHSEDVMIFNWLDITNNEVNIHPHNCAVWKAIYKKEILPRFDETLRVREDYFFQKELEKKKPSIYYYNRVLYMYNSGREGSLWWNETHK